MRVVGSYMDSIFEEAKLLIRSSAEVRRFIKENNGYPSPYIIDVSNKDKHIVFYGGSHTHDPKHLIFNEIDRRIKELKPNVVLVEGMRKLAEEDREKLFSKLSTKTEEELRVEGESTYTLKRGLDAGALVDSPEPTRDEEIQHAVKHGFDKETIFAYFMLRVVRQWNDSGSAQSFSEYVDGRRRGFEEGSRWEGFDYSLDHLVEIAEEISGTKFDSKDRNLYHKLTTPSPWLKESEVKPINEVSWVSGSLFRDEKILESISNYFTKFDRIFVVYGSGHALALEPAIKYLVENM